MRKRVFFASLAFVVLGIFLAASTAGAWSWQEAGAPYKGSTIKLAYMAGYPFNQIVKQINAEFTELTGIKVEMNAVNYGESIGKYMREMATGTAAHDLYDVEGHAAAQFAAYCVPIEKFENNPKLADPNFNKADIYPTLLEGMSYDNKLFSYPQLNTNAGIYFRKDLLAKYGVKEPTLGPENEWGLDEYYAAAKALTKDLDGDGKTDLWGTTLQGSRTGIGDEVYMFFWGAGGQLFDDKMKPSFGKGAKYHAQMVKALTIYQKLYAEGLVPPGSTEYELGEAMGMFQEGKVAMMWNWDLCSMWMEVPKAPMYGKIGMVQTPRSDKSVKAWHRQGNRGYFISKASKNQEAAFLFVQWLSSYPIAYRAMKDFNHSTPFRKSVVEDKIFVDRFASAKKLVWMGKMRTDRRPPVIPEWGEAEDIMASPFQKCMIGSMTPADAADDAAKGLEKMLAAKGYYKKGKTFQAADGSYPTWLSGNLEKK